VLAVADVVVAEEVLWWEEARKGSGRSSSSLSPKSGTR
jgi:hypothetical protein